MPTWLSTIVGVFSIFLSLYVVLDKKRNAKIARIEKLEEEVAEIRKVSTVVDKYMQELLLNSLRKRE